MELTTHRILMISMFGAASLLAGCPADQDATPNATEPGAEVATTTPTSGTTEAEPVGDSGAEDTDEPVDPSGNIFLPPDDATIDTQCDIWAQDCPEGQKCNAWANDGGGSWNATKCVPIDADPGQPGDACLVMGSGITGLDSCAISSMCWGVDPETNEGVCIAFCGGSPANGICDDPTTGCSFLNGGALNLCLPKCDPLQQNCSGVGEACYGIDDSFLCTPDASGEQGLQGDPCEFLNVCNPGLQCLDASAHSNCAGGGCCSSFCDLSEAQDPCPALDPGQSCVPAFEAGESPPGFEDVGYCAVPA